MSRHKIVVSIEDQITDFFMTSPQAQCESQLRAMRRIVHNRFPPAIEAKPVAKGNGKDGRRPVKVQKPALGNRLADKMQTGDNVPVGSVLGDGPSVDSNS